MFRKHSRIIAAIALGFFTWTSGGVYSLAHAAKLEANKPKAVEQPKKKAASPEERFSKVTEELESTLADSKADTSSKKSRLIAGRDEIDKLDVEMRSQFVATEQKLKAAKLPAQILERHRKFVKHYDDNLNELKGNIEQVEKAKDNAEAETALRKVHEHLKRVKAPSRHQKLDPNNLLHRQPVVKKREPRMKKEEFEQDLKKDKHAWKNAKRIQVASAGSLAGLLTSSSVTAVNLPTDADLAETVDVQLTSEIRQLAADLDFNPVKIYNFVKDYIEFVPTYGSIQGAHQTLISEKGNAYDQASLLIALLRASGIHAKYEYGTVELPIDVVKNWIGGFTDSQAAVNFLATAGVPCTALISDGKISHVRMEHIWAKAWIDYIPSRGAVHKQGDTWTPLDPSFKKYDYTNGIDFNIAVPFDTTGYLNEIKSTATTNEPEGWITGVNTSLAQAKVDAYILSVNLYIDTNYPNALEDRILGNGKIKKKDLSLLPASLPYKVNVKAWEASDLPASLRHTINFSLAKDAYDELNGNAVTCTKSLPEIVGKRITLSYVPATASDKATIRSLLPAPHSDSTPLLPSELPLSFPAYLINMVPELKIGGTVVAFGAPVKMGSTAQLTITLQEPPDVREVKTKLVTAGEYYAVALDVIPLGEDVVQEKILEHLDLAEQTKANLIRPTRDQFFGEFLHTMAVGYFDQLSAYETRYAASMGIVAHRLPSFGFAQTSSQTVDLFGTPCFFKPKGVLFDMNHIMKMAVARDGDQQKVKDYQFVSGLYSSGLEHAVLEQIFSSPINPVEGISTVKILSQANSNNIPIYTVTSANIANVLPKLPYGISEDVRNAVNAGKEIITPERNVTINGWTGTGYVVHDPTTGGGAYMISGGANGGFLTALGAYYMACGEVVYDDDPMMGMEGIMSGLNVIIQAQTIWLDVLKVTGGIAFDLAANFIPWEKAFSSIGMVLGTVTSNVVKNNVNGRAFQKIIEKALNLPENHFIYDVTINDIKKGVKPDMIRGALQHPTQIIEVKCYNYLNMGSGNMPKMIQLAKDKGVPLRLVVRNDTRISEPLLQETLGNKVGTIHRWDPIADIITPPIP